MQAEKLIRVMIADDHLITREVLASAINAQVDMEVCCQAANGEEAVLLFRQHQPDVTLMDLQMPSLNGVKATGFICGEFPSARILALTAAASPEDVDKVLRAGAKACLFKEGNTADIIDAIRHLHGSSWTFP